MLLDNELVNASEMMLNASGKLAEFVSENGPVKTRMVVTSGDTPEGSGIELDEGDVVFKGSFDDLDCVLGIVFDPAAHAPKSGMWVERQTPDAKPPSEDHVNLFAARIMSSISEEGTVELPVISFIAENGHDLSLVGFRG